MAGVVSAPRAFLAVAFLSVTSLAAAGPRQRYQPDQGWLTQAREAINGSEYHIRRPAGPGRWQSPNRAQNLRIRFDADGFTLEPRTDSQGKWNVALTVESVDKGRESLPVAALLDDSRTTARQESLTVAHDGFDIEYVNTTEGMRQNFLVRRQPDGDGLLRVRLRVSGSVQALRKGARDAILSEWNEHLGAWRNRVWYKDLKAWDAGGRDLAAALEVSEDGQRIELVVNDAGARYPVMVDPLSTTADWTAESDQVEARFGTSVSSAGDVNGDGYSDVIVGAPYYDNGLTDQGCAFVYHGSASGLSTTAAWTVAGAPLAGSQFGYSVSTAGDVNGDGYSDVVVGAPYCEFGQTREGYAFLYLGSATGLSTTAIWNEELNVAEALFGSSVACAGDVNGDGYSDVIVGAPGYTSGTTTDEGGAFVYHGSRGGLSPSPDWAVESNYVAARMGKSVAGAGDINGDGYSDVVVGAYTYFNGTYVVGRAYVYHGGSSGLASTAAWTAESDLDSSFFGYSVASAGDVNGDGYSDVAVGAYRYEIRIGNHGQVFVYHGGPSGLSSGADWMGKVDGGYGFGTSIAPAGDINGDGYSDLLIGATTHGFGGTVYTYYGGAAGLADSSGDKFVCDQQYASMGGSVASAGDVNGDGYADAIVGAPYFDNGQTSEGRAFALHGGPSGLEESPGWSVQGPQPIVAMGYCVSSAGDVNGDSYADVAVAAPWYDNGQVNEGRVFVYYGQSSGVPTLADWTAEPNYTFASFGQALSSAGDVNGDGYADLIVGAARRAYVYHGGPTGLPPYADWTVRSTMDSAYFGAAVSGAGDVNGDGYADVIVGAYGYTDGQREEGRAYVYYGGENGLMDTADWVTEPNRENARLGWQVAGAGDVNGDGYSDVLVSAPGFEGNGDSSSVRLFFGSAGGLSASADWTVDASALGAVSRFAISTAGDVNGDGYSDIVVEVWYLSDGQTGAIVNLGGVSGPSATPAWSVRSTQVGSRLGGSVASAGDVNGDGYDDVIVGAPTFDNGHTDEGSAFLYYGGPSGLSSTAGWSFEPDQDSVRFGSSVACAGDVNGDGYADVIAGAPGKTGGGSGAAYLFYGNTMGLRANAMQYCSDQVTPVAPRGRGDIDGRIDLGLFARSPLGRQKGTLLYEAKWNGVPFSGNPITTSVQTSGDKDQLVDLTPSGTMLKQSLTGMAQGRVGKWRTRMMYDPATAITGQLYGPWRYMPNDWQGEGGFRTSNMGIPPAPQLSSPADQSVDVARTPTLSWSDVTVATSYRVQVCSDTAFTNLVVDRPNFSWTYYALQSPLEALTTYWWRVSAANSYGTGPWSAVWRFTTLDLLPPQVVLVSPADGDTVKTDSVLFVWHLANGADRYWLELAPDSSMAGAVVDSALTDTSGLLRELSNGDYWWRVRAHNGEGWGLYSEKRTLVIDAPAVHVLPRQFMLSAAGVGGTAGLIRYALPTESSVSVRIYTMHGKVVMSRYWETQPPGYYTVRLDGALLAHAAHILEFRAGDYLKRHVLPMVR